MSDTQTALTVWNPEIGNLGPLISFDTETEMVEQRHIVPRYVLGQAYAGGDSVYLIQLDDLEIFLP